MLVRVCVIDEVNLVTYFAKKTKRNKNISRHICSSKYQWAVEREQFSLFYKKLCVFIIVNLLLLYFRCTCFS